MGSLCTEFVWPLMCIGIARRTSGRTITSRNLNMCLEVDTISIAHRDIARVQSRRNATTLIVFAIVHTLFVSNQTLVGGIKRERNQRHNYERTRKPRFTNV